MYPILELFDPARSNFADFLTLYFFAHPRHQAIIVFPSRPCQPVSQRGEAENRRRRTGEQETKRAAWLPGVARAAELSKARAAHMHDASSPVFETTDAGFQVSGTGQPRLEAAARAGATARSRGGLLGGWRSIMRRRRPRTGHSRGPRCVFRFRRGGAAAARRGTVKRGL